MLKLRVLAADERRVEIGRTWEAGDPSRRTGGGIVDLPTATHDGLRLAERRAESTRTIRELYLFSLEEAPALSTYLRTVGLVAPPVEAIAEWEELRRRYPGIGPMVRSVLE